MNINKTFSEILAECGGIEEMKKAFDEFVIKCETEIKVGYTVKVVDWGRSFSLNYNWFIKNCIPRELCIRYSYGNAIYGSNRYGDDTIFKVLRVYDEKALITNNAGTDTSPCYLVGLDALEVTKA